jgi:D-arabinose 1-dehydrogenase-like Zn-dependent alcohol dehydrogenase
MKKTMKAAVCREFGKPLAIEERPVPTPRAGEVLVAIMATGVYAEGKVHAHIHRSRLDEINQVFADLKAARVDGRIVLDLA